MCQFNYYRTHIRIIGNIPFHICATNVVRYIKLLTR
eukprot:UN31215